MFKEQKTNISIPNVVTFLCLFILIQPVCAIPTSSNDLWDKSQGSSVIDHSAIWDRSWLFHPRSSDIRNMFGGYYGYDPPHEETKFESEYTGAIHWVEW